MTKSKRNLAIIFGTFSILYGIMMLLATEGINATIFGLTIWFAWFAFCVLVVVKSRNLKLSPHLTLRFLLSTAVGVAVIWWSPWNGITSLAAHATGVMGAMIITCLAIAAAAVCCSASLLFVAAVTIKTIPEFSVLWFFKYVLIVVLVSIVMTVEGCLIIAIYSSLPSGSDALLFLIDGIIAQLLCGFIYYYVITSLMPKDANENALQPTSISGTADEEISTNNPKPEEIPIKEGTSG